MKEALIIILLLLSVAAVAVFIYVLLDLRKSLARTNEFLKKTEESLIPALDELQSSLKNINQITGEINGMTEDLRQVTTAVTIVGSQVEELAGVLNSANVKLKANIGGIKAGFVTALGVLRDNIFRKGGSDEE